MHNQEKLAQAVSLCVLLIFNMASQFKIQLHYLANYSFSLFFIPIVGYINFQLQDSIEIN